MSGAVAGITGAAWVKRRAIEMREAITLASVLNLAKDGLIAAWQWVVLALARNGLLGGGTSGDQSEPPTVRTAVGTQRRHIASRPHNSHR